MTLNFIRSDGSLLKRPWNVEQTSNVCLWLLWRTLMTNNTARYYVGNAGHVIMTQTDNTADGITVRLMPDDCRC